MDPSNLLAVSDSWKAAYPGALVGVLAMRNVANQEHDPAMDRRKVDLENVLRARFGGLSRKDISRLPSLEPYTTYYGRFKKTYHVQLQLESVALKGRPLPRAPALVQAMFMAELKNQLLTVGHDQEKVVPPLTLDVTQGDERYVLLNGQEQVAKPGDMMIRDALGIISSIIYGPDFRTHILPETRRVLFTVYGPPGVSVEAMEEHLADLRSNVWAIAHEAVVEFERVYRAD